MKKIITVLLLVLTFTSFSQVSRNRLKDPTYSWISRQVPVNKLLDSTFKSFWNINDDGMPLTSVTGEPKLNGTGFVKSTGTVTSYDNSNYISNPAASQFTAPSIFISGTTNNGYIYFPRQVGTPVFSNTVTPAIEIYSDNSAFLSWVKQNGTDIFTRKFGGINTANRIYTLPDNTGTVALLSDLAAYTPTTAGGYLPVNNPAYTGTLTTGALTYTDTNVAASFEASVNGYYQFIVQNASNGNTASSDIIVSNDQGTSTNFYGNFGMNSSSFTGAPVFNKPNAIYVTGTGGDLILGTTSANAISLATNNSSIAAVNINSVGVVTIPTLAITGSVTSPSFITNGGTASQFVKGNGSLDNSVYLTSANASTLYVPYSGATSSVNLGNNTFSNTAITAYSTGILKLNPTTNTSTASGSIWLDPVSNGMTFNMAVQALSVTPWDFSFVSGTHSLIILPTNDATYGGTWVGTQDASPLLLGSNFGAGNVPIFMISPQTTGATEGVIINPSTYTTVSTGTFRVNQGGGANILEVGNVGGTNFFKVAAGGACTYSAPVTVIGSHSVTGNITGNSNISSTSKTAGIGYAIGSGSTVTQVTSRTTGVTINAITGSITLFSAAGSATPFTFVVTNSAVTAKDIVFINQQTGTDKYTIQEITALGPGTFNLTLATSGGTTTESPVFNFVIIKGQTN